MNMFRTNCDPTEPAPCSVAQYYEELIGQVDDLLFLDCIFSTNASLADWSHEDGEALTSLIQCVRDEAIRVQGVTS